MGFCFSGNTTLKYYKRGGYHRNSTDSCRVYSDDAFSYKERFILVVEHRGEKIILYNTYKWSPTTSSHQSAMFSEFLKINPQHAALKGFDVDFSGSMNHLVSSFTKKSKPLNIEDFKNCKITEDFEKFLNHCFSAAAAKKLLKDIRAREEQEAAYNKEIAAKNRLEKSLENFKYSNIENFKKALARFVIMRKSDEQHTLNYLTFNASYEVLSNKEFKPFIFGGLKTKKIKVTYETTIRINHLREEAAKRRALSVFNEIGTGSTSDESSNLEIAAKAAPNE